MNYFDIVILNLKPNSTYSCNFKAWGDCEFDYSVKFNYGQLFINGNGAIINGNDQSNNFMFVGLGAVVNVVNVTISKFNHCFINYGEVLCYGSSFVDNRLISLMLVRYWVL